MSDQNEKVGFQVEVTGVEQAKNQLGGLKQAVADVGTSTQQVMGPTRETFSAYQKQVDLATDAARKSTIAHRDLALGLTAVGASAVGVVTGITSIERAHTRLEQVQQRAIVLGHDLEKMRQRGQQDTVEYSDKTNQLAIVQDQLNLAQDRYNDSLLNFASSTVQTVVSSIFILQRTFDALKVAKVANMAADAGMAASSGVAAVGTGALGVAAGGATIGVTSLTASVQAFFIANWQLTVLLAGAAIGLGVWESNLGNLRGMVESATGSNLSLGHAISGLIHPTTDASQAMEGYGQQLEFVGGQAKTAVVNIQTLQGVMTNLNAAQNAFDPTQGNKSFKLLGDARSNFAKFADDMQNGAEDMRRAEQTFINTLKGADTSSAGWTAGGGMKDMIDWAKSLGKELIDRGGDFDYFWKQVSGSGKFDDKSLKDLRDDLVGIAKASKEAQFEMDELKKKRSQDAQSVLDTAAAISSRTGIDYNQIVDSMFAGVQGINKSMLGFGGDPTLQMAWDFGLRDFGQSQFTKGLFDKSVALAYGVKFPWNSGVGFHPINDDRNTSKIIGHHTGGDAAYFEKIDNKVLNSMLGGGIIFASDFANQDVQNTIAAFNRDPTVSKAKAVIMAGLFKWNSGMPGWDQVKEAAKIYDDMTSNLRPDLKSALTHDLTVRDAQDYRNIKTSTVTLFDLPTIRGTGAGASKAPGWAQQFITASHLDDAKWQLMQVDNKFLSESDFQNSFPQLEQFFKMNYNQVLKMMETPDGLHDIQSMLRFANEETLRGMGTAV